MEQYEDDELPHKNHRYEDVKTFISWSAPGRPFRKKGREFYLSGLLIVVLIELILLTFGEFLLMLVVVALYFLAVAMATVPPQNFHYRISNQGIKVEDHFYIWDELYDFYFKKIDGMNILIVRTHLLLPAELKISLGEIPEEHVRKVLVNYLPYREVVKQTFIEKSGDWLGKNFPLER